MMRLLEMEIILDRKSAALVRVNNAWPLLQYKKQIIATNQGQSPTGKWQ